MTNSHIPKRIFYVWDGPLKPEVQECISSWNTVMPDYDVIELNNTSPYFNLEEELIRCSWFKTVFDKKYWAYISDYIRVKALYDHGGIYCDTDITALQSFEPLLENKFFAGFESRQLVNLSIFGCVAGHPLIKDIYEFYQDEIWNTTLFTIPEIATYILQKKYGCILYNSREFRHTIKTDLVTLYPEKSFYPYRYDEIFHEDCVTKETFTIHWWGLSWGKLEILQWLHTKHLAKYLPKHELAAITEYRQHTAEELKAEVRICGVSVLQAFKQGYYHVYKICGIPIFAIRWIGKNVTYFLFAKFKLFTREN